VCASTCRSASALGYDDGEIEQWNRQRIGRRVFAPYSGVDPPDASATANAGRLSRG
jgi:hypothetical protein